MLLGGSALANPSPEPKIQFPVRPRDRLAVTSWPFRMYITSAGNRSAGARTMDLKDFPAFVVEKFGVHNVNPLADHFSATDDRYLAAFRDAVHRAGSHVVDLGLSGGYFYDPDRTAREAAIDYGRRWIDIAVKVGSPSVRQHLRLRPGQRPEPAIAAEGLRPLAEYGAHRNIVVNLENDNAAAEDPFVLVAVIEKVNSPYLRALPDFGNTLASNDESYNARGVKAMLTHAWNMCHVKDSVETAGGHTKTVDLAVMFALASQCSYRGYYSMEFDTDAGDPIAGTQRLIQKTLQYLS